MTIYRRRKAERAKNRPDVTVACTPIFLSAVDRPVTSERKKGHPSGAVAPKKARGYPSSQTATTMAVDRYATLPLELRIMALGLQICEGVEKIGRANAKKSRDIEAQSSPQATKSSRAICASSSCGRRGQYWARSGTDQ